ncbi:PepSY-associated TM helix domain-containing protein [Pedobacter panaciterrae]
MNRSKSITKLAFSFHSWLGLISGVFLLLLGLSGSALVFLEEIDHAINAELLKVKPSGKILFLDALYRKIGHEHPNVAGIAWLNPDAVTNEAYEFRLYQNDGKISTYDLGMVSINPYSGKTLREGNLKDLNPSFMHWIFQFHWSFQLGIPGLLLATVFGITMLLSTITGLIIYRKHVWKVLSFKEKMKWNNWRTISSGLHRIVGVWALAFNVVIFFTGFWMNKFSLDPAYWKKQTVSTPINTLSSQNIDEMLSNAKKNMPDLILKKFTYPPSPERISRQVVQ